MSITELWETSREQLADKQVNQIIAFAGGGQLSDGSNASSEFRAFLGHVHSELLEKYSDECLTASFPGSGFALQDIMNQVGERLGFSVEYGRYRGKQGAVGFDGLWTLPDGHSIVVEVKTTDAYRIDLGKIGGYRRQLAAEGRISEDRASALIIVGRQDTGDLEAQIRGSRFAWDMRLIGVYSLLKLMRLRETMDDPVVIQRIYDILIPREFTKLDDIVEIVFSAAEEVVSDESEEEEEAPGPGGTPVRKKKPKFIPVAFHAECIARIQKHLGRTLVKRSRSKYSTPDGTIALTCSVSKEHARTGPVAYWFAFHPHQKEYLGAAQQGYVALGCGSEEQVVLIPFKTFVPWLEDTWTTETPDRMYWHVRINKRDDKLSLNLRRGVTNIDLSTYLIGGTGASRGGG